MQRSLLLIILALFAITCKKENKSEPSVQEPTSGEITLITTSAKPGQLVIAQANFKPTQDTAIIKVGDKHALAMAVDSNRIAFYMPELGGNSNYTIEYRGMGTKKNLSIRMDAYTVISDPDQVYSDFINKQSQIISNFQLYESNPHVGLNPGYTAVKERLKQEIQNLFATLSTDDKKQVAYVLQNNIPDPIEFQYDAPDPKYYSKTTQITGPTEDGEDRAFFITKKMLTNGSKGLILCGTGIAMIGGGLYVAPAGVFGLIGGVSVMVTGYATFLVGLDYLDYASIDFLKLINGTYVRVSGTEGMRLLADTLILVPNVERSFRMVGNFRTILESDQGATNTLLKMAFEAKNKYVEARNKVISWYTSIKSKLGSAPNMPSGPTTFNSTSRISKITMAADKLSVSGVSNPNISIVYTRQDSLLKIKATSSLLQNTNFSFNTIYTNTNTGTTISDKINAYLKVAEDTMALLKSKTWVLTGQVYYNGIVCCNVKSYINSANLQFYNRPGGNSGFIETKSGFASSCGTPPNDCYNVPEHLNNSDSAITLVNNKAFIVSPIHQGWTYTNIVRNGSRIISISPNQLVIYSPEYETNLVFQ